MYEAQWYVCKTLLVLCGPDTRIRESSWVFTARAVVRKLSRTKSGVISLPSSSLDEPDQIHRLRGYTKIDLFPVTGRVARDLVGSRFREFYLDGFGYEIVHGIAVIGPFPDRR